MKILKKRLLFSRFLPFYVLAIFIFGLQSVAYSQTIISGNVNNSINIISITDPNCGDCNNSEACRYTIEVSDASNFSANDRVLIVQMKGATIDVSNTETGGRITDIGNAGNYEFFIVGAVDAANNYIYPRGKLKRTYDDAGLIQLVKVPSYSGDVEINSDIIGDAWDPATGQGGVVAIFVEGTLTFNADIDVSGRGYQGVQMLVNGTPDDCSIDPLTQMVLPSTSTSGAKKGQGIVIDDNSSNKGRAPRANGGGGGVSGDSGGGGGSNYGAGGAGGNTWCNSSRLAGGLGGVEMATYIDQNRIYFGGAGGSGFVTTDNPSSAANGGGMVIIRAKKIIGNGHTINASGTTPIAVNPTGSPDGGGGGGGGGSVVFEIQEFEGTMDVAVNGGDGQDLNTNIHHGPGGGGGGGAFLYNLSSLPAGINVIANGGAGGVHSDGATNGSQDGSAGGVVSYFNLVYSEEDADNDNISDFCDLDTDNDGILDADEDGGTGFDPSKDADGDNIPNYKDASDATPGFPVFVDTNGDGVNDIYDKDKDHIPDFKDLDSDNDGFVDAVEAGGVADASGVLSNYTDTDLDGLNDTVDPDNGGTPLTLPDYDGDNIPDFLDIDSDDDGISDAYESSTSTIATGNDDDNDGIDNAFDPDLSGVYNALIDRDGDSHYDMFDIDSDNDGITDYYESSGIAPTGNDTDKDGVDDAYDVDFTAGTDVDGDWIDDNSKPKDTDSDSRFDIHDLDSDADGIIDNIEGQTTTGYIAPSGNDTDNDGLDDAYDGNNSGATIIPTDTDGDLTADFLDTNSDNDPDSDLVEAYDSDNDGVSNILPSGTDTDNDGLDDNYDAVSGFNPTDGGKLATDYPDLDDPGDDRDWRQNVPTVTLTLDKGIIAENVQTATFTATLNATTFNDVTINLVYSGSANGSNVDYNSAAGTNATSATTIVIPAGQLSGTVTVTSVDDASVESAETVVVDILSVTNAKEDGVQQKTTTISDNDAPGISVSAISNNTNENGQTATFTIVLNSAPSNDVTINLTSDNLSEGTLSASSIVFTSGNWNTAQEITVTPVDDPVYEPDISFNIITSAASSVDLDYDGMAVDDVAVINEDDDSEPTVNLSINNATINESTAGTATVTATLSNPSTQPATVNITYGGTATATDDYTTNAAVINIAAGATTGTVVITAVNDDIYESGANETVTATLGTLTNCSAGTTTSVGTAIVDDEPIPVVAFNATSSSGLESVSSKDLQVDLSGSLAVTVDYVVTGTATGSGTDYTLANGTLTIPAGSTSKNITIASIVDDALDETNETVIVTLSNPSNASLGTNQVHTYTITDNDNAPTVADKTLTIWENVTNSSAIHNLSDENTTDDTDPDGDNITYSITAGNDNNIFAINSNTGVISIADNSKWSDVTGYSLTILASDGNGNSDNATVDVTVLHFPDVINDTESITENNSSINSSQSLLTNDNDVDGETLTVSEIDGITDAGTDVVGDYGTLNWSTDGTFVYTLNNSNADVNELQNGDSLEDIFTYTANDGNSGTTTAKLTITINGANDAPVSADNSVSTKINTIKVFAQSDFPYSDPEGDALTQIKITTLEGAGSLFLDADDNGVNNSEDVTADQVISVSDIAKLKFEPALNASGVPYTTFKFMVYDGTAYSVASNTMTINVSDNTAPTSADKLVSTNEDVDYLFDGTEFNFTDVDVADALNHIQITALPAKGTLYLDANDNNSYDDGEAITVNSTIATADLAIIGYLPAENENGSPYSTFQFKVNDGIDYSVLAYTVTINVTATNDNPAAVNDSESITENTVSKTSAVALLTNDSDVDGDAITVSEVEGEVNADTDVIGSYGTLNWSTDGTYVYTLDNSNSTVNALNVGDDVTDSFNYTISDGNGGTSSAQLIVTISGANDAPVADVETVTVPEGDAVTINLADGDTDADGTIDLGSMVMSSTSHGTLVDNGDGTVTYTHDGSETNSDSFTYTIKDNDGAVSNEVTVDITVTAVNDAPVARNDVATMNEGTVLNGNSLLANDSDPDGDNLVINTQPVSGPSHGTVTINSDGTYVYNPEDGYVGGDAFVYEVCDTNGACTQATVSITISMTDVNESPIAVDDDFETVVDGIISGNVLTNDLDPDGDELQVTTTPLIDVTHGVLTLFADGTFEYIPNEGWYGDDTFTYQVCDTKDMCSMADVTITVNIGDVDGDRIPDSDEGSDTLVDTDGDGTPDYRDVDSDNDGVSDADEIYGDCDGDGILNRLDADNCDFSLHIPKGFSPNGDGVNDGFVIPDIQIFSHVSIEVFNRWGTIIFKDDHFESNTTGWAGTSNVDFSLGKELPTGTYFYIVKIYDTNETKSGYIYLNR